MSDSSPVSQALGYANAIDEGGELPYAARRQLLGQLAQYLPDRNASVAFKGRLGLSCARRSWPVWQAAYPEETRPMAAAESVVTQAIAGQSDTARGQELLGEVKADLDERLLLGEAFFTAVYAGFSCWAAARDVLAPEAAPPPAESELQLSPEEWDPCFFSSLALAGGATWDGQGDPRIRRAFWRWYLEEAVPDALERARQRRSQEPT
jgi:Immunity protein Imm5